MTERVCPHCGMGAEGTTNVDRDDPAQSVEDLDTESVACLVCLYCSGVSIVEPGGAARLPTVAEAREIAHDPQILAAVAAVDYRRAIQPWPDKGR